MAESGYTNPYPLGAHLEEGKLRFSFASRKASCGIILYDRKTGKQLQRIPFTAEERIGNLYCKCVEGLEASEIAYLFYEDGKVVADWYARAFLGRRKYGVRQDVVSWKAIVPTDSYDWEGDARPRLPGEDCVVYCMHVRGFTAHGSSGVACRGTFRGIIEKLPYLQESGFTTLELQPAYEFAELPAKQEGRKADAVPDVPVLPAQEENEKKLNYWGYQRGYYYAPKSAYAWDKDAVKEFKDLVKALHERHMELVMQFYFPKEVHVAEIPELLRFWVLEYHVDGFHLMGENLPVEMIAADACLADTKLWYYGFRTDALYGRDGHVGYRNLSFYQDDYCMTLRKYLKGDENMLSGVLHQMRYLPPDAGRIHYITNYSGFTLMDLVSYDQKHNEANGEENRDGNSYNCSWNCGEEGTSRKARVRSLRLKLIKNAFCMLLFSQSSPLIFMGDEFGNSQKGNNNPYCQDNLCTWLDWRDLEKNREIYVFWKQMVEFRRNHPILHPPAGLRLMDYAACGYPDLSYHGENAWRPDTEYYSRHIGLMFCGKYARTEKNKEDAFIYLAMNMHWEKHFLALPRLPKGMQWKLVTDTAQEVEKPSEAAKVAGEKDNCGKRAEYLTHKIPGEGPRWEKPGWEAGSAGVCHIGPRSIAVYISVCPKQHAT